MNKLCGLCLKQCKQEETATIVECKRFWPAPVQMAFKFKVKKGGVRKHSPKKAN